jgi:hypothetical protein
MECWNRGKKQKVAVKNGNCKFLLIGANKYRLPLILLFY